MKLKHWLLIAAGVAALVGCKNTAEGMKEDAQTDGQAAAKNAQDMSDKAADASKDAVAATMLTPKIKLAITADKDLNDSKNLINVDSTDAKVTLQGHVATEALKKSAGDIANKVLKDNKAKQTLENNLEVKSS